MELNIFKNILDLVTFLNKSNVSKMSQPPRPTTTCLFLPVFLPALLFLWRHLAISILVVEEPYQAEGQDQEGDDDQHKASYVQDQDHRLHGGCGVHGSSKLNMPAYSV